MSYSALYRKFRPQTFSQVKGQDHITTTLKNQIKSKRIGHAYLFCGTRGTGKTTVAKILSRAINCDDPRDGDPCGICPSCKSILAGTNTDVIEMDAASNNGVDDMRNIIEEVSYTPGMCRYRVYIVDEVHMLSNAAFNAFLKTLEEPPAHAVFILATTDPQRLPATILSRCQRYDFHRMDRETIKNHMEELLSQEGIQAQSEALLYVAGAADGSMRDGLSILDQCIAFHQGEVITYENVLEVLGAVDREVFASMYEALLKGDVSASISLVDDIIHKGRELTQFVVDFTGYVRDRLIEAVKSGDKETSNICIGYIRELSDLTERIRYATLKRVLLDTSLIKLCHPDLKGDDIASALNPGVGSASERIDPRTDSNPTGAGSDLAGTGTANASDTPENRALIRRLTMLEKRLEELEKSPTVFKSVDVRAGGTNPGPAPKPKIVYPAALPQDLKPLEGKWRSIIGKISPPASTYLNESTLTINENSELMLVFEDDIKKGLFLRDPDNEKNLKDIITGMINKSFELTVISKAPGTIRERDYPNFFDKLGMPVEIED